MITCDGIAGLSNCRVPSRLRSPIFDRKPETTQEGGIKMKSERIMDKLAVVLPWVAMILCLVLALILTFR